MFSAYFAVAEVYVRYCRHGAEMVDVPVRTARAAQMMRYASGDSPTPERTADVNVGSRINLQTTAFTDC